MKQKAASSPSAEMMSHISGSPQPSANEIAFRLSSGKKKWILDAFILHSSLLRHFWSLLSLVPVNAIWSLRSLVPGNAIWSLLSLVPVNAISLQPWTSPEVSRRLRLPDFKTIGTLRWEGCQPYAPAAFTPQEIFLVLISVRGWVDPGHSATGRNVSMKNSNDTIGNRTCDLPACSAVPQTTAPLRASLVPIPCQFQPVDSYCCKVFNLGDNGL